MKSKFLNVEKIVIALLIIILIALFIIFFNRNRNIESDIFISGQTNTINVNEVISNIKLKYHNLKLDYETQNIKEFISLVYKKEPEKSELGSKYKSIIIDTKTGKELSFTDLIKPEKFADFTKKEIELLKLKYPEFIVDGITLNKGQEGYKFYYVKDNEVIVFYYNYEFDYEYNEIISLQINYNEIKSYLEFTPILDSSYEKENGLKYEPSKKSVALTFDDGPSGQYNGPILAELAKNKAHATFFMVGRMMESHQNCVVNTFKSGNEVASHTYEHMNIKRGTIEDVNISLNKVKKLYHDLTNDNIKYLRPPYGAYSKENLENVQVPFILWNLDTEDWRYHDVDHIVNYIIENVSDGSIILMHELYETSYEALKIVLPKLYAMGYQVVSVSELAQLKGKNLESGKAYSSLK